MRNTQAQKFKGLGAVHDKIFLGSIISKNLQTLKAYNVRCFFVQRYMRHKKANL